MFVTEQRRCSETSNLETNKTRNFQHIVMGILATPPKATPPKKEGLLKGLLTIGFP